MAASSWRQRAAMVVLSSSSEARCRLAIGSSTRGQQFLRQPCAAVGPRNGYGERFWLAQQGAEVLPDQRIELTNRRPARGTAGQLPRIGALPLAVADIVGVPPAGLSTASQATNSTAHQSAQQV